MHIRPTMLKFLLFSLCLSTICKATVIADFPTPTDIPITTTGYSAAGKSLTVSLAFEPAVGTKLTVVKNTGLDFIAGEFGNLAQGQRVDLAYAGKTYAFVANYYGGNGNDLVLQWAYQDLAAWGFNSNGQLGNNGNTNSNAPVAVTQTGALLGKTVTALAAGSHSLALCSDGSLAAWGDNYSGQFGNGSNTSSGIPVTVPKTGALTNKTVVAIAAGTMHSLALCSDGTIAAWGNNNYGQLGNNTTINSNVPVQVTRTPLIYKKTVVAIAANYSHNLALCSDGTLVAWGYNAQGQLGNHTLTDSKIPTPVETDGALASKTVAAITTGDLHCLVLCTDGTLVAWGDNSGGQLGNNTKINSNFPVTVIQTDALANKTVTTIVAGGYHNLVLCDDGALAAWGYNFNGQLGNNTKNNSAVPMLVNQTGVLANKTVNAITAGYAHNLAMCTNGEIASWGYNNYGQLGNPVPRAGSSIPVLVNQTGSLANKPAGLIASSSHNLTVASVPNSADLNSIVLSTGALAPTFDPTNTSYTVPVPPATTTITATPSTAINSAGIQVNGMPVTTGIPSQAMPLASGGNPITIQVTAPDGVTTKTYIVTITKPPGFGDWKLMAFPDPQDRENPEISGELATPANDGIPNLIKYALALKPKESGAKNLPTPGFQGEFLTLTYRRNKSANDVSYIVEASDNPVGNAWQPATEITSQTEEGDHWLVTVKDNVTKTNKPTRFMRLRILGP